MSRSEGGSNPEGDSSPVIGITGALGFVGARFTTTLLARGWRVRTFTRRSWEGAPFVPVEDRRELFLPAVPPAEDLEGLDAIVHLAVAPHGSSAATTEAVNTWATQRLYEAATAAGVPRFVFVSTQSAHDGALNRYGRTKRAAERSLQGRSGVVVVRPGLVYDGGGGGLLGLTSTAAAKVRVFPVVGGQASVAQTVHMDDLCDTLAMLAIAPDPPALVEVAEPEARPLGTLVADATDARFGIRPRTVDIPLPMARSAARFAERIGVGEAVAEVVRGIDGYRPMDTAGPLDDLGVHLRPFDPVPAAVATDVPGNDESGSANQPRRLLLVGAGRIGMIHGLCSLHHTDAVLAGVVDPDRSATSRLQALLGRRVATFRSVEEAFAAGPVDAAIVATPPVTHVDLALSFLEAGTDVLVEKPVAPQASERRRLIAAAASALVADRSATVAGGYNLAHLPHVHRATALLRSGAVGAVHSFTALAFVARADGQSSGVSWELDPDVAGGGALPQVAAHTLSMLDALVGPLEVLDACLVQREDRQVEDAAWVQLTSGTATGSLFTGWHVSDFVIPENSVRLRTEQGTLIVSMASAVFLPDEGAAISYHCLDEAPLFDPAPADGGAGFYLEQRAVLEGESEASVTGPDAIERIERIATQAYARAERIMVLPGAYPNSSTSHPPSGRTNASPPVPRPDVLVDLRRIGDPASVRAAAAAPARSLVVGTVEFAQLTDLPAHQLTVVVPDIPGAFRKLTNQGPVVLLRDLGPNHLTRAALGIRPGSLLTATGRIWAGFAALARTEAAAIPKTFRGSVLLDGYLVDLAAATGQLDELVSLVAGLRRRFPRAQIGVETNAPRLARIVLPLVRNDIEIVMTLGQPGTDTGADVRAAAGSTDLEVLAKTGPQPPEVVAAAAADPGVWVRGDDRLVADWRGVAPFADRYTEMLARAMRTTGCPEWALQTDSAMAGREHRSPTTDGAGAPTREG